MNPTDTEPTATVNPPTPNPQWCDRCGGPLGEGDHDACRAARTLEPPRYCAWCRRRMKVQVLPTGWRATCVEHGNTQRMPNAKIGVWNIKLDENSEVDIANTDLE